MLPQFRVFPSRWYWSGWGYRTRTYSMDSTIIIWISTSHIPSDYAMVQAHSAESWKARRRRIFQESLGIVLADQNSSLTVNLLILHRAIWDRPMSPILPSNFMISLGKERKWSDFRHGFFFRTFCVPCLSTMESYGSKSIWAQWILTTLGKERQKEKF